MEKAEKKLEDLFTNETTATVRDFKALTQRFNIMGLMETAPVPLSYIIQSLYPNVPKNLEENMKEVHRMAYMEGYNAAKAEIKGDKE